MNLVLLFIFGLITAAIADAGETYENIASKGKATQSDNKSKKKGHAHLAIDGNTDGRYKSKSVTHTKSKGVAAYWRLDFSETYYVSTIKIWNRVDKCCAKRLNGATVRLDGGKKNILTTLNTKQGNPITLKVDDGLNRITIRGGKHFLTLAEVEVFGYAKPDFSAIKNIAGEGEASQSDTLGQGAADLAIDGNTDGRWASGSVSHTTKEGADAFWRLDFSETYHVTQIRVWNRVDKCCFKRLNGVTVRLDGGDIIATLKAKKGSYVSVIDVDAELKSITINGGKSVVSLAEVEVFGYVKPKPVIKNIAGEGTASQSNTFTGGFAHQAIDGNTDGRFSSKSVTHTGSKGLDAVWRLVFSKTYYVSKINIWNRVDCCSDRLNGVSVRLDGGKKNLFTRLSTKKGNPNVLDVNDGVRRITITGYSSFLSLAEVEVFGYAQADFEAFENVASNGKATQSDNYYSKSGQGLAQLAIDGKTDGRFFSEKSVTHTKSKGLDAVWRLDFSKTHYVSQIRIWNRVDCCSDRLNGVSVRLDGGKKNLFWRLSVTRGNPNILVVEDGVKRITITGYKDVVSLAEVEVFGYEQADFKAFENVASNGKASQSDNYSKKGFGLAQFAIDGRTDGRYIKKSVTHTLSKGKSAYWRLEFDETYYVSKIRIWNRIDCCLDRLDGVTVRLNNEAQVLAVLSSKKNPNTIEVAGDVKLITLQGGTSFLSLAEVEVFGEAK